MKTSRVWLGAGIAVLAAGLSAGAQERAMVAEGKAGAPPKAEFVGASTCLSCHEDKKDFKDSGHGLYLKGEKKIELENACETCHGPGSLHASAGGDKSDPNFATVRIFKKIDAAAAAKVCLSCHKQREVQFWNVSAHAAADLTCATCHSVHSGGRRIHLKNGRTGTCLECHKDKRAQMNLPSHHPVLEGKLACADCHNPHGGEFGNLRAESNQELCFKCHAEKAGPFIQEHPPVREDCAICHDPHGTPSERLLKQNMPFLCMRCHKWPHTGSGNAFPNSDRFVEYGKCVNCHREIHGTDHGGRFTR